MALQSRILCSLLFVSICLFIPANLQAQRAYVTGIVSDTSGSAIPNVTVYYPSEKSGTLTGEDGRFRLQVNEGRKSIILVFSCIGYIKDTLSVNVFDLEKDIKVYLISEPVKMKDITVTALKPDMVSTIPVPTSASVVIPSVAAGVEAVVKSLPGVASFNELSYQYSVRGGSFDENLVYINDIEIFKPYLIRSGQQEGMSQINPDLTASVNFSPGGFSALYGDRMSSVLDIKYRKPENNEASVSLSLLTSSLHAGAVSKNKKAYFLTGLRYRSNALLLRSLDIAGQYKPMFTDLQAIAGYKTGVRSELTLLVRGSSNKYSFIPESQTTTFGTLSSAYKLYAAFEGGERDVYSNLSSALTFDLRHNSRLTSRFILSSYFSSENENYDIRGAYSLSALDKTENSQYQPDSLLNIGIGSWLEHARNKLETDILSLTYHGTESHGSTATDWGITGRYRDYNIRINEWQRVDSAGYTIGPESDGLQLTSYTESLYRFRNFSTELFINNMTGFTLAGKQCKVNAGARAVYDSFNNELFITPRASLRIQLTESMEAHLSIGAYNQSPGGRELMHQPETVINNLGAQRSYHLVTGATYDFQAWERPFRFTVEAYGKMMDRMIPYTVDNVRMVYYGGNIAKGYTAGLDLRVNGEFVEGVESWFALSLMRSEMKIPSYGTGWFPSPFDQRLNVDIFFQDYLPGNPDFRAHINLVFGTGIPTSPPGSNPWDYNFRMPPYRRLDIGFSKILIGEVKGKRIGSQHSAIKELIAGLEIFNLADIRNTISYTWIKSVDNSDGVSIRYAVPNYLTSRSLNFKVTARF